MTKLMYALAVGCLTAADKRKLDGFQCRCLRAIWGIKSSFISRVSNFEVRQATQQCPATRLLERQMVLLYGEVARQPSSATIRKSTFCEGSLRPATDRFVRRVGRPRLEWARTAENIALRIFGSSRALESSLLSSEFSSAVSQYFSSTHP